jgi:ribosomal subunit interface protein
MTLRITGKNMDIGEALRGRIDERIRAGLAKYLDGHCEGHVTVVPDGSAYQIDCVRHLRSGITVEGTGTAHDPYMALDQAAVRIEKRLRRHRERLRDRAARIGNAPLRDAPIEAPYAIIESPEDEFVRRVSAPWWWPKARRRSGAARERGGDRARSHGRPFVMFQHAGTGRLNVVYRRRDGRSAGSTAVASLIQLIDPSARLARALPDASRRPCSFIVMVPMPLSELLIPEAVLPALRVQSKKQASRRSVPPPRA